MYSLRFLFSLIYFWGLHFPANSWAYDAQNQRSSNNIPIVLKRPSDYRREELARLQPKALEFIVAYKGYVTALLHIQASETRKKLLCLGKSYDSILQDQGLGLSAMTNGQTELAQQLRQQFANYKNSGECKTFLDEEVQKLVRSYSDMKAYLALHQSSPHEIQAAIQFQSGMGVAGTQALTCEEMTVPLRFGSTKFCFERLITLLDPQPDHILRSVSLPALDKVLGWALKKHPVPRVLKLDPLIWEEVLYATELYDAFYSNNEYDRENRLMEAEYDFDQMVRDGLSERQKKNADMYVKYHRSVRDAKYQMQNYNWASQLQAQGTYVFSDYPENSAPKKYVDLLSAHPVLAFYQPPLTKISLNCLSTEIKNANLTNLCEAYKTSYSSRLASNYGLDNGEILAYDMSRAKVYPQLIKAYEEVLKLNMTLIKALNLKYDSSLVFVENSQVNLQPAVMDLNNWSELVGMEMSLKYFLEKFPEYQGSESEFVSRHERAEFYKLSLQIGGAVGLGVACGFLGGWPLVACLGAAGLGVNVYFYNDSLNRHNDMLLKYFSTSTSETADGLKLSLVDFEKMRSEVQGLYLDTFLIGVGLGVRQMGAVVKSSIRGKQIGRTRLRPTN